MALTMLESALRYRRRGFSVIPCKRDKKPYLKSWQPYQIQKPSEDEIRKWWTEHPEANIAIVCGPVSGVDVLDCDSQEAYDTLNDFYLSESFATPTVKTPKGRHLYFKHRSGLTNAVRAIKGTDIRTFGGYVIAPPSRNGSDTAYYWFDGLTPKDVEFSEWPEELFAALQAISKTQCSPFNNISSSIYKRGGLGGDLYSATEILNTPGSQEATKATNGDNLFKSGQRDNDLFHVANCLTKGGCEPFYISKILETLAKNCYPPFDEKEIPAKIQSAMNRKEARDRNLAFEIREWVLATSGDFSATSCDIELHLATKTEKKNRNKILERLCKENPPLIERAGNKNGWYRLIDQQCQPEDWVNSDCSYMELWLPLNLGEICGVQPGNILIFAGAKDSGKTAFLMNIAKENRHHYKVHYFNSEMGKQEFKLRAKLFDDISINEWTNFNLYTRSSNFHDVLKKGEGNLNIIDYLEAPEEAYRIGPMIKRIHDKLEGSICVIGLQKKIGQDLGRGAEFSMEKSRLYVSLDYQKAKIISCKNFKENEIIRGNPRGYTCNYKLLNGCKIIKSREGWTSEIRHKKDETKMPEMQ